MSTYIILVNFTSEGIKGIKDLAQRWKGLEDHLTRVGGRLVSVYMTIGQFDGVATVEAPDDEKLAGVLLEIGRRGNARTTTLKAFNREQTERIISSLS